MIENQNAILLFQSELNQFEHLKIIPFLGQTYQLKFHLAQGFSHAILAAEKKEIHLYLSSIDNNSLAVKKQRKKAIENFYKLHLKKVALSIIQEYSTKMNVSVKGLKIKKVTSYWGVCYWKRHTINLNIALCLLPFETIRAVVVHELCHLLVPNHSKKFYDKMTFFLPSWKKDYELLKDNKALYLFQDLF